MAEWVFWICFSGLLYIYLAYPALVWMLARCFPARPGEPMEEPQECSILIVAFNEAARLGDKLQSLLHRFRTAHRHKHIIGTAPIR